MSSQTLDLGMGDLTSPSALKASFAEFLATALLVFIGVGSVAAFVAASGPDSALVDGLPVIATGFGLAIAALAAGARPISGGHINPAVTFAMIITGNISVVRGVMYIVAQLTGAVIGMLLLKAFLTADAFDMIPAIGGNGLSDAVPSNLAGVGLEALGTFVLVWTVFAVAVTPRGSGNLAPLFIGFAVLIVHLVLIPFTGCGINPARTFGPAVVQGEWKDFWVYVLGPLIGAALASLSYTYLYLMGDEQPA